MAGEKWKVPGEKKWEATVSLGSPVIHLHSDNMRCSLKENELHNKTSVFHWIVHVCKVCQCISLSCVCMHRKECFKCKKRSLN